MNNALDNEKGAALVVTLAIVAILLAAALQLGKFTGDSVMATLLEKDRFQAEQLALSGINLASIILVEDAAKNTIDSVQEIWADSDKLSQAVDELGLAKEALTIKIVDELSKIQVNALIQQFPGNLFNPDQNQIWENLLRLRLSSDKTLDKRDPAEIVNSLKDWLDSMDDDAITGISGAESEYYLDLDPPYVCANGPFNHIDELVSVKGISTDLLENELASETDDPAEKTELGEVFTVYGLDGERYENGGYRYPGQININTADFDVLSALLPEGMDDLAVDLAEFREEKSEQGDVFVNSLDKGWYKKILNLSEKEQKWFERGIRYSSNLFRVESTGKKNETQVRLIVYLQRERYNDSGKWICRTIQMERE